LRRVNREHRKDRGCRFTVRSRFQSGRFIRPARAPELRAELRAMHTLALEMVKSPAMVMDRFVELASWLDEPVRNSASGALRVADSIAVSSRRCQRPWRLRMTA
jgi:hypothetical protein